MTQTQLERNDSKILCVAAVDFEHTSITVKEFQDDHTIPALELFFRLEIFNKELHVCLHKSVKKL